jgi:hypothetical protein
MNGTSGFQEVRSSTSRSPLSRFLQEQRHRFGTGSRHILHTHELTGISTKREKVPNTTSVSHCEQITSVTTSNDESPYIL